MTRLKITCLGSFQAFLDGAPLIFDTDKARALLAYLSLQYANPQRRQHLAGLLWSDMPEERALHNLRQTLSVLRKTLGDEAAASPILLIQRDSVQLNPACDVWLDVAEFKQSIETALRYYQLTLGNDGKRSRLNPRMLKHAVELYRGPFLDQLFLSGSPLFEEWASLEREALNQRAIEAYSILAELFERRGEYTQARQFASQIVALAPWDETAQVQVIRLLAIEGRWSAAQAQYRHLQQYLREQLGVEPAPETEALFTAIRQGAAQNSPLAARYAPARHNLPSSITLFVGREHELNALTTILADPHCRLLTLHGPGGVGKTRLALQIAEEQRGIHRDGVFIVSLSTIPHMDLLPSAIAEALQFTFSATEPLEEQLLRFIAEKHMLWVLDNLEQLLPLKPGSLISQVLRHAPGIVILATSRQRLNLQEEVLFPVEGLTYPESTQAPDLEHQEAIQLFIDRSLRVRPGFSLATEADRHAVVNICQLLEGLPLWVELAAAAMWAQSPAEIAMTLKDNLHHLASESINVDERHRSLWAAFETSWALLTPEEQHLLARLSVYRGGIASEIEQPTLEEQPAPLNALLEKSLLRRLPSGRYEMHEAIRQFAAEKLALDAEQAVSAHAAHAHSFSGFLQTRVEALKSARQSAVLAEIALEWENVRQAWGWLVLQRDTAALTDCAEAVFHFCTIRTRYQEGIELFAEAISHLEATPAAQAKLLTYQGALAFRVQENDLSEQALERGLSLFATHPAPNDHALCLVYASGMAFRRKNPALARQRCEQSLDIYTQTGDAWGKSYALYQLGLLESRAGHVAESQQAFLSSLQIARALGDQRRQIGPLNLLGDLACQLGDYAESQAYFEEALTHSRALDDRFNIAQALINLGTSYQYAGQIDQARGCYEEGLSVAREIGDLANQSLALINLGELALETRQFQQSIRYLQQAMSAAEKAGDEWAVMICWIDLCDAAVGQGDGQAARQYLRTTLPLVEQSGEPALLLRAMLQLGRLELLEGRTEKAIPMLGLVIHHEATYDEHRQAAQAALMQAGLPVPSGSQISLDSFVRAELERMELNN